MKDSASDVSSISILSSEYDTFPEISALNTAFRTFTQKLKVSLEIDSTLAARLMEAGGDFHSNLLTVCPSLKHHDCRSDAAGVGPLEGLGKICGRRLENDPVDIAHLLEHMVIDLVVEISGSTKCSGVTCGLRDPENQFHVYVECEDSRVGMFAVRVATAALTRLLESHVDPAPFRRQVNLARWLVDRNGDAHTTTDVAHAMGWSKGEARATMAELVELGFLTQEKPPINFSGMSYFTRGRDATISGASPA